jgi:DHA3 family macrolide efflux protein-like MFS transporter
MSADPTTSGHAEADAPQTDEPQTEEAVAAAARPHWKRDVVVFLSSQTVTLLGSMLVQYAVMWHLTLETKSGVVMALAALFGFLPQAVVSIFGGVWADRLNRKWLIIAADATIAATTLGLALFILGGVDALWLIYLTLAIRSAGAGIQMPAVSALVPQLVPTQHLLRINGINGSIQSGMMLIAPAMAGAIYAWAAAGADSASGSLVPIFFIDVFTAIVGIGLLIPLAVPTIRHVTGTGYFADLVEGVKYTFSHKFIRWLLILFAIVFVLTVAPSYLTPLMLVREFGDDVWMLTVLEIAFSVGMVAGGVVIAAWGGTKNKVVMIAAASLVFGVLSIALGLSPNVGVFFGFMLLVGLAVPFFSTPSMTLLQLRVEPEKQGRVFGFVGIVMAVAMPLGMVIFGPLADQLPVQWILVGAGILTFIVVGLALVVPAGRTALREGRVETPDAGNDPANWKPGVDNVPTTSA